MPLPVIDSISPTSQPATSFNEMFLTSLTFGAGNPSQPWPTSLTWKNWNAEKGIISPDPSDVHTVNITDVKADSTIYPATAAIMASILDFAAKRTAVYVVEKSITQGLMTIVAAQKASKTTGDSAINAATVLANAQNSLTKYQNQPDTDDGKAAAVTAQTTVVATATSAKAAADATKTAADAALLAAKRDVWVTKLGQWFTVSQPLGVTDVNVLPMALQGLTRPEGI